MSFSGNMSSAKRAILIPCKVEPDRKHIKIELRAKKKPSSGSWTSIKAEPSETVQARHGHMCICSDKCTHATRAYEVNNMKLIAVSIITCPSVGRCATCSEEVD